MLTENNCSPANMKIRELGENGIIRSYVLLSSCFDFIVEEASHLGYSVVLFACEADEGCTYFRRKKKCVQIMKLRDK